MAKILVFNNDTNRMETYYRGELDAMPYNTGRTLVVREFRGSSRKSNTLDDQKNNASLEYSEDIFGEGQYLLDSLSKDHGKVDIVINHNIMPVLHLMSLKGGQMKEEHFLEIVQKHQAYGLM